ncbi:hypothetical protein AAG906_033001 [Vitis piasezkii]
MPYDNHLHHSHLFRQYHRPHLIYYMVILRLPVCSNPTIRIRKLRVSDSSSTWDDLDSIPMASLLTKFRMPNIERYMGVGCPYIHLQLYSTVMRAHGLDESQMITMFPLSLSGAARCWFASLKSS